MSVVVTATSGHLGRLIVHNLLRRGVPAADIVAGARSLDSIAELAQVGVRTTVIDYDDPTTLEDALEAGDTFVLVSGNDLPNRDRQHADAIAVAGKVGVGHLIYTSGLRAAESPSPIAASHAVTEDAVRASGIPFTLLRNGWYTENYARSLDGVRATGSNCSPASATAGSPRPPGRTSPKPSGPSSPARDTSAAPTSSPVTSRGPTTTSPPHSPTCSAET